MAKYILIFLVIGGFAAGSVSCKKVYPESPLQFDSLDQSGNNLARFTTIGNYLCAANGSAVKVYNIQDPANPVHIGDIGVGATILSLRTYKDSLLVIGTFTGQFVNNPLNIYRLKSTPELDQLEPLYFSQAYDPFTNKGNFLLSSESAGGGPSHYISRSELFVYDVNSPYSSPTMVIENVHAPVNLVAEGNNLFVCDSGLKVFDITDVSKIKMKKHFNIEALNVLSDNGNLTVLGTTGLFQYLYASDTVTLRSKINIVSNP